MRKLKPARWRATLCGALAAALVLAGPADAQKKKAADHPIYRGLLGEGNVRIKHEGDKTFVWAGPRPYRPSDAKAQWYDFTGAPFAPEQLQFGIGRDAIPSIDDPLFVKPDDPRLLKMLPPSPYRRDERPKTIDEIQVMGFVNGDDARAYPIGLLDRHELVNDTVGGKPVTVGW